MLLDTENGDTHSSTRAVRKPELSLQNHSSDDFIDDFGHPRTDRLYKLLRNAGHDDVDEQASSVVRRRPYGSISLGQLFRSQSKYSP
jgi:hypothetical protein